MREKDAMGQSLRAGLCIRERDHKKVKGKGGDQLQETGAAGGRREERGGERGEGGRERKREFCHDPACLSYNPRQP